MNGLDDVGAAQAAAEWARKVHGQPPANDASVTTTDASPADAEAKSRIPMGATPHGGTSDVPAAGSQGLPYGGTPD